MAGNRSAVLTKLPVTDINKTRRRECQKPTEEKELSSDTTAVKELAATYEVEVGEKKFSVCKQCKAGIAHGKLKDKIAAL